MCSRQQEEINLINTQVRKHQQQHELGGTMHAPQQHTLQKNGKKRQDVLMWSNILCLFDVISIKETLFDNKLEDLMMLKYKKYYIR